LPTLLYLCPFRLVPPRGGGALRALHLLRQLAGFADVHAVVFQHEAELREAPEQHSLPDNVQIHSPLDQPPPATLFDRLPRRIGPALHFRWLRRSCRGPADATLLQCHHLLAEVLRRERVDAAVMLELSALAAAPLIRRLSPGTVRILDAFNVNHLLLADELRETTDPCALRTLRRDLRRVEWTERHLDRFVHGIWTCSEQDRGAFQQHNRVPAFVVPNGVDTRRLAFIPDLVSEPRVLFCGSLRYPPNADGLRWFWREVWPHVVRSAAAARLTVVGSGGQPQDFPEVAADPRVDFAGEVPDVAAFYSRAAVAVCPLRFGSGTRLKILEAMSLGAPVVSTRKGAEGIECEHDRHLLLADAPDDFAAAVVRLLTDRQAAQRLRRAARMMVEQRYDWDRVADAARASLEEFPQWRRATAEANHR